MAKNKDSSKKQLKKNAAKKKQDHAEAARKASGSQVAMGWVHPATIQSLGIKHSSLFFMSKAERYAVLGVTSRPSGPKRKKVANLVTKALKESGSPKDIKAALKEAGVTKDERNSIKSAVKHHDASRLTEDVEDLMEQSAKKAAKCSSAQKTKSRQKLSKKKAPKEKAPKKKASKKKASRKKASKKKTSKRTTKAKG